MFTFRPVYSEISSGNEKRVDPQAQNQSAVPASACLESRCETNVLIMDTRPCLPCLVKEARSQKTVCSYAVCWIFPRTWVVSADSERTESGSRAPGCSGAVCWVTKHPDRWYLAGHQGGSLTLPPFGGRWGLTVEVHPAPPPRIRDIYDRACKS